MQPLVSPSRLGIDYGGFQRLVLAASDDQGSAVVPGPRRVLIVEDEYFIALEIEHWLTGAGHEMVAIAAQADEAVAAALTYVPDLVVMDIRLQ
jgi:PleD family two-component response regulator